MSLGTSTGVLLVKTGEALKNEGSSKCSYLIQNNNVYQKCNLQKGFREPPRVHERSPNQQPFWRTRVC